MNREPGTADSTQPLILPWTWRFLGVVGVIAVFCLLGIAVISGLVWLFQSPSAKTNVSMPSRERIAAPDIPDDLNPNDGYTHFHGIQDFEGMDCYLVPTSEGTTRFSGNACFEAMGEKDGALAILGGGRMKVPLDAERQAIVHVSKVLADENKIYLKIGGTTVVYHVSGRPGLCPVSDYKKMLSERKGKFFRCQRTELGRVDIKQGERVQIKSLSLAENSGYDFRFGYAFDAWVVIVGSDTVVSTQIYTHDTEFNPEP